MMMNKTLWGVLGAAIVLASSPATQADITTGLTHRWTFDETEGNFAADSVGGNTAILGGFAVDDPTWTAGKIGGALRFSKDSHYALTTGPIVQNQYSISFWSQLKIRTGVNPRIVTPQDTGYVGVNFFDHRGVGMYPISSPVEPTLNRWEHYVCTLDMSTQATQVFMNGALVAAGTAQLPVSNANWIFAHNGAVDNPSDPWNGLIDDVRIYNRILTPADVLELFPIAGDFDFNRIVDAADLAKWRQSFVTSPVGDADYDNDADGHDFLLWQRHLGETRGAVETAVPEPSAHVMLLCAVGCLCRLTRRLITPSRPAFSAHSPRSPSACTASNNTAPPSRRRVPTKPRAECQRWALW